MKKLTLLERKVISALQKNRKKKKNQIKINSNSTPKSEKNYNLSTIRTPFGTYNSTCLIYIYIHIFLHTV